MPPKHYIEVILLYGPSGCGKTQWFLQHHLRDARSDDIAPGNLLIHDPLPRKLAATLANPGEYQRIYVETTQRDQLRAVRACFTRVLWWKKDDGAMDGPTTLLPDRPEWELFWNQND